MKNKNQINEIVPEAGEEIISDSMKSIEFFAEEEKRDEKSPQNMTPQKWNSRREREREPSQGDTRPCCLLNILYIGDF